MARAAAATVGASVGIGVTGVAGPDQQEDQPVGTVHIAITSAVAPGVESEHVSDTSQRFRGDRQEIKWRAAITALSLLRLHLLRGAPAD
jgi:nicotinamide-nucleotide amidase